MGVGKRTELIRKIEAAAAAGTWHGMARRGKGAIKTLPARKGDRRWGKTPRKIVSPRRSHERLALGFVRTVINRRCHFPSVCLNIFLF